MDATQQLLQRVAEFSASARGGLPAVTLTYAQSLDGSLASAPGVPTAISGAESLRMTHALRAAHDAILVGVGTILADNPSLTVRLCDGACRLRVSVHQKARTACTRTPASRTPPHALTPHPLAQAATHSRSS